MDRPQTPNDYPRWALSRLAFVHELRRTARSILDIDPKTPRSSVVWLSLELSGLADALSSEWFDRGRLSLHDQ
ncbi:MAG: hypothetical protein EOM25_15135 [Deltaproteobacteria bacterium]|nr:hypothetical protein [Deltaproteobacteria bacterium]